MRLLLLGPPGGGKGTISEMLKTKYGWCHISPGEILREKAATDPELKATMASGKLLPDDMIIKIMVERFKKPDCGKGFMLDGFPRTVNQATKLQEISPLDAVILMECPDELIITRISSRKECRKCGAIYGLNIPVTKEGICNKCGNALSQRDDDKPETIKTRLNVYREQTLPVVEFYKKLGMVKTVDGSKKPEEVLADVVKIIEK